MRSLCSTTPITVTAICQVHAGALMCPILVDPIFRHYCLPLYSIPYELSCRSKSHFNRFVIGRFEEPHRNAITGISGAINEIVDSAVCLLPAFEAISWRNVTVAHVETIREADAFSDVSNLTVHEDSIYPTAAKIIWNPETTERPVAISVKWQIAAIIVSMLGHELLY
jgi:hypothetical protein